MENIEAVLGKLRPPVSEGTVRNFKRRCVDYLTALLIKPIHANWLMCTVSNLSDKHDVIRTTFELLESKNYINK